jgi:hypothetical protein
MAEILQVCAGISHPGAKFTVVDVRQIFWALCKALRESFGLSTASTRLEPYESESDNSSVACTAPSTTENLSQDLEQSALTRIDLWDTLSMRLISEAHATSVESQIFASLAH